MLDNSGKGFGCSSVHSDDWLCNCDDLGENNVDEGLLSNKDQLPVTQLNYGDSESRYSWIFYSLGSLRCSGKSPNAMYPSESDNIDYYFKYYSMYV